MKKIKLLPMLFVLAVSQIFISSCKENIHKEIDITYRVTASTLDRDYDVTFANDLNGKDVEYDISSLLWEKTYTMDSDTSLTREFYLYVNCWSNNNISQTIKIEIIEDGIVVKEETVGGSASISKSIYAYLPSENRFE